MSPAAPTLSDLARVFGRIGLIGFGGPAGQIALMHRTLVEERGWLDEGQYLRALNFCTLLPGPEAQQLATYAGWRLHGVAGGLIAGSMFLAPGAALIVGLSILYAYAADLTWVEGAFFGVKAAVLAIIAQALWGLGRRALNSAPRLALAIAAFNLLFLFDAPFPLVILGAGLVGAALGLSDAAPRSAADTEGRQPTPSLILATLRTVAIWAMVWAAPVVVILLALGPDHVLMDIAAFFSRLAVVSFGGAYAVLSYMAQAAVETHGWIAPGEMADGLGLAETTPGPLILVTQFVGFLAAFRLPEPFSPLMAGVIGAGLTTWMTFAPCFLWIFALAPWIERLESARRLQSALAGVTAAVVGVIANLTVWFALHVLFTDVGEARWGPVSVTAPDPASAQPWAAALAIAAAALLMGTRLGLLSVLGLAVAAGVGLRLAGWV